MEDLDYIKEQLDMRNEFILHTLESYIEFIDLLQNNNIPDTIKAVVIQKRKDDWLTIYEDIKSKIER